MFVTVVDRGKGSRDTEGQVSCGLSPKSHDHMDCDGVL